MRLNLDEAQLNVTTVKQTADHGVFSIGPLPPNYGHTLGNSLRRILLSSLPGAALSQVRFENVPHQFTTIPGVKEDVVEITLNLKQVRLKINGDQPVVLTINKKGPGEVLAGDIDTPAGVEVVNKDLHLATLADKKAVIAAEFIAEPGSGYVLANEREAKIGVIALDSLYSPVIRVSYKVEPARIGRVSGYDQLTLDITTDRSIKPLDALAESAQILSRFFDRINRGENSNRQAEVPADAAPARAKEFSIDDLDLSARLINSLKKVGVRTVADLLSRKEEDLLAVKNVGPASLKELDRALKKEGLR